MSIFSPKLAVGPDPPDVLEVPVVAVEVVVDGAIRIKVNKIINII